MDFRNPNRSPVVAFATVVLGMCAFGAAAQSVSADAQARAQVAPAQSDAALSADAQAQSDVATNKHASNVGCVKETGTNIRPRDPKTGKALCVGPGRTYSREQIDRTGQTDLADALRRLDPSVH